MNSRLFCLQFCVLLAVFLFSAGSACGQSLGPSKGGGSPVKVDAARLTFDKATNTYTASGGVRLSRDNLTLRADRVTWNADTGEAKAVGHVHATQGQSFMTGSALSLNLNTGLGRLEHGRLFLKDRNFHLSGDLIEKTADQSYRVVNGTFTTCDGAPPSWSFSASRLDVTLGRYAKARNTVFHLNGIPVFYLPYMLYPIKTQRQSGFLMPHYGYSTIRGTQFSLGYYQVLGRNQDATFFLDYYSKLGVGKGLQYRYIFGDNNQGTLHAYHITGITGAPDRYALSWKHLGTLPGKVGLAANVEYVSSRDYFAKFGNVASEYSKDRTESVVSLRRAWDRINLSGQLKYVQDLQQPNNNLTLQRLPEIKLNVLRHRVQGTPFYYSLDATSTYFWRKQGFRGERLNLRPALAAAFHLGDFLEVAPEVGYRERFYETANGGPGFAQKGMADFTTLVSTRFDRVFDVGGQEVKKIQHSIEPEITYTFVPAEDQSRLPQFDSEDNIGPQNKITYALTNRFTARLEPEKGETYYHEFLYLRLSQSYNLGKSTPSPLYPVKSRTHDFSDLRGEMILRPTRWTLLDLNAWYNVSAPGKGFDELDALGGFHDGGGNSLSFDYRYLRDGDHYVDATATTAWLKPVYVSYQHRYDIDSRTSLGKILSLEYRAQCWSVFLTYRDRPGDQQYMFTFALAGIGRLGGFGGSLGQTQ